MKIHAPYDNDDVLSCAFSSPNYMYAAILNPSAATFEEFASGGFN